ncbi:hypothetical protein CEP88_16160 [Roseobacter denitrificans]|nr:hypothetical protein CEP88_16160 [Roseobacter denitrificans]SFG14701.1 hypothetical protein SAMN05443635_108153 [Roseobacter denitrificans OCh 114]
MPDGRLAQNFLSTARRLAPVSARRPNQANLRRCISTCYYAVFHALAKTAADSLVGATKSRRPNKAWVEVYRGLGHGACKDACKKAGQVSFPQEVHDFADAFIQLQEARHRADYDPMYRPNKAEALVYIALAEKSIATLKAVPTTDKKAFVAWVLITSPGAKHARELAKIS